MVEVALSSATLAHADRTVRRDVVGGTRRDRHGLERVAVHVETECVLAPGLVAGDDRCDIVASRDLRGRVASQSLLEVHEIPGDEALLVAVVVNAVHHLRSDIVRSRAVDRATLHFRPPHEPPRRREVFGMRKRDPAPTLDLPNDDVDVHLLPLLHFDEFDALLYPKRRT
jgi:hypothetical protein